MKPILLALATVALAALLRRWWDRAWYAGVLEPDDADWYAELVPMTWPPVVTHNAAWRN